MYIKIIDPNLRITIQGDNKKTLTQGIYEVTKEIGNGLINTNHAIEITQQEFEQMTKETEKA